MGRNKKRRGGKKKAPSPVKAKAARSSTIARGTIPAVILLAAVVLAVSLAWYLTSERPDAPKEIVSTQPGWDFQPPESRESFLRKLSLSN